MRPLPQVGENLPMVIKPDHLRNDPPGCFARRILPTVEQAAVLPAVPVFVVVNNGEKVVSIPVHEAKFDSANGGALFIVAEVEP